MARAEVVELHPASITSLLKDAKGYCCVVVNEVGGGDAFWKTNPEELTPEDVLNLIGRMTVELNRLSKMYLELTEVEDVVEL